MIIRAIYVIHNLPQYSNEDDILKYRSYLCDFFEENENIICSINCGNNTLNTWHQFHSITICVNHFFIGNKFLSKWNGKQLKKIKNKIESLNPNRKSLIDTFKETLEEIGTEYYQFDHHHHHTPNTLETYQTHHGDDINYNENNNTADENHEILFSFNLPIKSINYYQQGANVILGNYLDLRWLDPIIISGVKYQRLFIGMNKISNLTLQIVDNYTILCSYKLLNFNNNQEYIEEERYQHLHTEYSMDINQGNETQKGQEDETTAEEKEEEDIYPIITKLEDSNFSEDSYVYPTIKEENTHTLKKTKSTKILNSTFLEKSHEMMFEIRLNEF